jgi:hypothetical protein
VTDQLALALALGLALPAGVSGSSSGSANPGRTGAREDEMSAFVARVRAATEKYLDRDAAVADGYRLIGEDFPGMSEHWIHIGLLFDCVYDPERPEFLSYVTIGGRPRLLGVAYGLPLLRGESPPDTTAGPDAWHEHVGSVDDETFLPHHHQSGHGGHGPRLVMLHAWVWLPNPEGVFAADNWAIPFLRLGLEAPAQGGASAGKALALLSGADSYILRMVRTAVASPVPNERAGLRSVIDRVRGQVASVLAQRSGAELPPGGIETLERLWEDLWQGFDGVLPAEARARVQSLAMR